MTLGLAKGWIMLGHVVSEEAGMLEMAQWIKGFVPEVRFNWSRPKNRSGSPSSMCGPCASGGRGPASIKRCGASSVAHVAVSSAPLPALTMRLV